MNKLDARKELVKELAAIFEDVDKRFQDPKLRHIATEAGLLYEVSKLSIDVLTFIAKVRENVYYLFLKTGVKRSTQSQHSQRTSLKPIAINRD